MLGLGGGAGGLSGVTQGLRCDAESPVAVHRFSRSAACGILVPRPGIKPTSPALQGSFLTTGPPGKLLLEVLSDQSTRICEQGGESQHRALFLARDSMADLSLIPQGAHQLHVRPQGA